MKHVFRKTARGMSPTDEKGRKAWAKLPVDDLFFLETISQRHARHHRLYWATVGFFAEHSGRTSDHVHTLFKDLTGRFDLLERADGKRVPHYHSTSYASMDEEEFSTFHKELIDALWKEVMPDVPEGKMRRELEGFLR